MSHCHLNQSLMVPCGQGTYYLLEYDVILLLGLIELEEMVAWKEDVGPLLVYSIYLYSQNVVRVLNSRV